MKKLCCLIVALVSAHPAFMSPAFASPESHPLVKSFPQSSMFKSSEKIFDRVSLVGGPIEYVSKENEGYLASSLLTVVGESKTYISDYSNKHSAEHLHQEMMNRLSKDKFEVLYTCSGPECGDISGWNLYLSEFIEGNEYSQHYSLATQKGSKDNIWYVQFFVIDLDGEPRSFFRVLNVKDRPALKLAFNSRLISVSGISSVASLADVPAILFEFDKAILAPEATSYILKLKNEILESGVRSFVISGHTDNYGSLAYNQDLSMRRALVVAAAMKEFDDLSGVTITVESKGESQPIADNNTANGRKANRRVSIDYSAERGLVVMDVSREQPK